MANKLTKKDLEYLQSLPLELKIKKTELRIREWYEYWSGDVYVAFSGGKDSTVLLDIVRRIYPNIEAVYVDTGLEYPEIKSFVKQYKNITILKPEHSFKYILSNYGYPVISKDIARTIDSVRNFIYKRILTENNYVKYQLDILEKWVSDNILPMPVQDKTNPEYGKPETPIPLENSGITSYVASLLGLLCKDRKLMWRMPRNNRSTYNKSKWRWMLNSDFKISDKCCLYMKKKTNKTI